MWTRGVGAPVGPWRGLCIARRFSQSTSSSAASIEANYNRRRRLSQFLAWAGVGLAGVLSAPFIAFGVASLLQDYDIADDYVRFCRSSFQTALASLDYKWSLRGLEFPSPEYEEARSQVHLRSAQRILKVSIKNGASYIKLGQYIASLNHLLPGILATLRNSRRHS